MLCVVGVFLLLVGVVCSWVLCWALWLFVLGLDMISGLFCGVLVCYSNYLQSCVSVVCGGGVVGYFGLYCRGCLFARVALLCFAGCMLCFGRILWACILVGGIACCLYFSSGCLGWVGCWWGGWCVFGWCGWCWLGFVTGFCCGLMLVGRMLVGRMLVVLVFMLLGLDGMGLCLVGG